VGVAGGQGGGGRRGAGSGILKVNQGWRVKWGDRWRVRLGRAARGGSKGSKGKSRWSRRGGGWVSGVRFGGLSGRSGSLNVSSSHGSECAGPWNKTGWEARGNRRKRSRRVKAAKGCARGMEAPAEIFLVWNVSAFQRPGRGMTALNFERVRRGHSSYIIQRRRSRSLPRNRGSHEPMDEMERAPR
jgi:hypothetical protein